MKHLAPYLPYGLKINTIENELISIDIENKKLESKFRGHLINIYEWDEIKPILRPLSDLFKLIDWDKNGDPYMIGYKYGIEKVFEDGEEFYANEYYADYCESPKCYVDIISFDWWLFEHHFDVFGLIEQNLAININTL